MKTGRTLQQVGEEILRQSQVKQDYLVNTQKLVMEDWGGKPMLHLQGEDGLDLIEPLEIQQTAHRQLGDYLGIPRRYYDRMLGEDVELLTCNVNHWLRSVEPDQRMIRTMDGRAHLGRVNHTDEDFIIYSQETLAADNKAFVLKLQDTVSCLWAHLPFAIVRRLRGAEKRSRAIRSNKRPWVRPTAGV